MNTLPHPRRPTNSPPLREIAETHPAVLWNEMDWLVAFRYDEDLYFRILKGIGKVTYRTRALTPQQITIVKLLADGYTAPQIGRHLFVSTWTVRDHIRRAFEKAGAKTQAQLAVWAVREGLI